MQRLLGSSLGNFKTLHTYAVFYSIDLHGHSKFWRAESNTTPEGKAIDDLFTSLTLSQIFSEPTNFTPAKKNRLV